MKGRNRGDRVAITFVNGYLCTSSCDASKAATGQNPHPKDPSDPTASTQSGNNTQSGNSQSPAVTYGGSLTGRNAVTPTSATSQTGATSNNAPPSPLLDIQA